MPLSTCAPPNTRQPKSVCSAPPSDIQKNAKLRICGGAARWCAHLQAHRRLVRPSFRRMAGGAGHAGGRGAFILFEGVDRCGKTTQSRRLVDYLTAKGVGTAPQHTSTGLDQRQCADCAHRTMVAWSQRCKLGILQVDAELLRFPDRYTPIGRMIDAYLTGKAETDDAAVHLLFSANRWEKRCSLHTLHVRAVRITVSCCMHPCCVDLGAMCKVAREAT